MPVPIEREVFDEQLSKLTGELRGLVPTARYDQLEAALNTFARAVKGGQSYVPPSWRSSIIDEPVSQTGTTRRPTQGDKAWSRVKTWVRENW